MKRAFPIFILLALVTACQSPVVEDRHTELSFEREAAVLIPALLEEHNVPGAAVAIIMGGEVVHLAGYGVTRAGTEKPVTPRTVFQAASLSKPVVAYGAHVLVQEAKLDLDRPLSKYLDTPYLDDPRIEKVTARIALSHTTGWPNWRPRHWTDDPGPLEFLAEPAERFGYSGEGYVYLQRAMEAITGETLDVYLKRAVLDPLGMSDSSFVWEERFEAVHASPHDSTGEPQEKWRPRNALAAGTLQTTAADYARFLQAVMIDSPSETIPLREEAIHWMLTWTSTVNDHIGWSLGWGVERISDGTVFWQWGDDGTFKAFAAGSRELEDAVVVLTNGEWGLDVGRPIVSWVLGERAFLDFENLNYR